MWTLAMLLCSLKSLGGNFTHVRVACLLVALAGVNEAG